MTTKISAVQFEHTLACDVMTIVFGGDQDGKFQLTGDSAFMSYLFVRSQPMMHEEDADANNRNHERDGANS